MLKNLFTLCLFLSIAGVAHAEPSCNFLVNGKALTISKRTHLDTIYYEGYDTDAMKHYFSVVFKTKNDIGISYADSSRDLENLTNIDGSFDSNGSFHAAFHSLEGLVQIHCAK